MYIDEGTIVEPLPEGWPNITPETMRDLNKTDEVIDILRHLPYIRSSDCIVRPQSAPQCCMADWNEIAESIKNGDYTTPYLTVTQGYEDEFGGKVPDDCLAFTIDGRNFGVWLMDTYEGLIYWMYCPVRALEKCEPRPAGETVREHSVGLEFVDGNDGVACGDGGNEENDLREEEASDQEGQGESEEKSVDEEEEGQEGEEGYDGSDSEDYNIFFGHPCWRPHAFFAMLTNHFKDLNFVPGNTMQVLHGIDQRKWIYDIGLLKSIYRKNRWPDPEQYDKKACLEEVAEVIKRFGR